MLVVQLLMVNAFIRSGECTKQGPLLFEIMSGQKNKDYRVVFQALVHIIPVPPRVHFGRAVWSHLVHYKFKEWSMCRPTVGQLSVECWPTVGRLSANCQPARWPMHWWDLILYLYHFVHETLGFTMMLTFL